MKASIAVLTFLFLGQIVLGQAKQLPCNCPRKGISETGKAGRVFDMGNGRKLGLCGFMKKKDTVYSECVLFECGQTKTIEEWDTESFTITQKDDTLFIRTFAGLPIGKNFDIVWKPFEIQQLFYRHAILVDSLFYASDVPKYSPAEIKKVLAQYSKLTKVQYDEILLVSHRLFWATVSGSVAAGQYLLGMEKKFGPFDGAIAEEYKEVRASYELWKDKH